MHAVHRERRHRQPVVARPALGPRPEHAHAVDGAQALVQAAAHSAASWAAMVSQPMRSSSSMAVPEGDRADHVGRAGLLALGRIRPDHLVEVDQVDRAAARQERVAVLEHLRAGR